MYIFLPMERKIPLKRQMLARQSLTHFTFTESVRRDVCICAFCMTAEHKARHSLLSLYSLIYFSVRFEINFMTSVPHTSIALRQWLCVCVCATYLNALTIQPSISSTSKYDFLHKKIMFSLLNREMAFGWARSEYRSSLQISFDACLIRYILSAVIASLIYLLQTSTMPEVCRLFFLRLNLIIFNKYFY